MRVYGSVNALEDGIRVLCTRDVLAAANFHRYALRPPGGVASGDSSRLLWVTLVFCHFSVQQGWWGYSVLRALQALSPVH